LCAFPSFSCLFPCSLKKEETKFNDPLLGVIVLANDMNVRTPSWVSIRTFLVRVLSYQWMFSYSGAASVPFHDFPDVGGK